MHRIWLYNPKKARTIHEGIRLNGTTRPLARHIVNLPKEGLFSTLMMGICFDNVQHYVCKCSRVPLNNGLPPKCRMTIRNGRLLLSQKVYQTWVMKRSLRGSVNGKHAQQTSRCPQRNALAHGKRRELFKLFHAHTGNLFFPRPREKRNETRAYPFSTSCPILYCGSR